MTFTVDINKVYMFFLNKKKGLMRRGKVLYLYVTRLKHVVPTKEKKIVINTPSYCGYNLPCLLC